MLKLTQSTLLRHPVAVLGRCSTVVIGPTRIATTTTTPSTTIRSLWIQSSSRPLISTTARSGNIVYSRHLSSSSSSKSEAASSSASTSSSDNTGNEYGSGSDGGGNGGNGGNGGSGWGSTLLINLGWTLLGLVAIDQILQYKQEREADEHRSLIRQMQHEANMDQIKRMNG